ncbi:unnamed protein product [Eruca vesicaria subsp. sativa]|uniref:Uncharacterized protein n=1 Tax=Eruca vesicaria subsp. sativa TaxID=29727 RepID=A0ABC8JCL8_ERUVS|nr:unnamed protein product [Eruca vesicaria subsp. sativa]
MKMLLMLLWLEYLPTPERQELVLERFTSSGSVPSTYIVGNGVSHRVSKGRRQSSCYPEDVEDMAEGDVSSRAGNFVLPNVSREVSDVSSSSGPVKLADLQRIMNNLSSGPVGLAIRGYPEAKVDHAIAGDVTCHERLSSHLPEGHCTAEDILELLQSPPM